jgi:hypothetical protein
MTTTGAKAFFNLMHLILEQAAIMRSNLMACLALLQAAAGRLSIG